MSKNPPFISAQLRLRREARFPDHPPAIWTAFVRAGAWKSWVIAAQLALLLLMTLAAVRLARRPPDVVLVDPTGKSTYVPLRTAEGLSEQRPSPHAVAHFCRDFLFRFLAVNSSTIHAAWPEALSMMAPSLRAQMERLAAEKGLLDAYRAAQVRTDIELEQLELVEGLERAIHVRAVVLRRKQPLMGGPI